MTNYASGYIVSANAPSNPDPDDRWYDLSTDLWKRWNGTAWKTASSVVVGSRQPDKTATTQQVFDSLGEMGQSPRLVVPPAAVMAASASAAWYVANAVTALRFHNPHTRTYRYVNIYVGGASSGNIELGVARLQPIDNSTMQITDIIKSTGVIACPGANGTVQADLGYFILPPGDYVLYLWCDNTAAQFLHGLATGVTASRMAFSATPTGGVQAVKPTLSYTTRWVTGLTLEAPKLPVTLLGDSITANDAAGPGSTTAWFSNTDRDTGYRFRPAYTNAGVAGQTTTQILARITDLTGSGARYATILAGTNDVGLGVDAATIEANLASIYSAAQGMAGLAGFAVCTITPRTATAAQATVLKAVNAWIRSNYTSYSKAVLVDWTWALSDGTDEASPLPANFSDEGGGVYVHPTTPGVAVMQSILTKAIKGWI